MKRHIVKTVEVNIIDIQKSKVFADDFFIITDTKGTSIHPGLTQNNQNPRFGEGGSFIVSDIFLKNAAHSADVPMRVLIQNMKPRVGDKSNCTLTLSVERRVVGEQLENELGEPQMDNQGNPVVFRGQRQPGQPEPQAGDEYVVVTDINITLSGDAVSRNTQFIMEQEKENTGDLVLPKRRTTIAATVIPTEPDANSGTSKAADNAAPVRQPGESQAKFDARSKAYEQQQMAALEKES